MQAIQSAITFMQNLGAACMMPNVPHRQKSYKGETLLMGKLLLISDLDKTLLDNNAKVPQPCLDSIAAFTAQFRMHQPSHTRRAYVFRASQPYQYANYLL